MLYLERVRKSNFQNYRKHIQNENNTDFNQKVDTDKLRRIYNDHFTLGCINPGHKFCLIKLLKQNTSTIIGTVSYWHGSVVHGVEYKQYSKILDIEIHEKYRGKGYGTRILKMIIKEAQKINSMYLSLFVFETKDVAFELYKKLDFQIWNEFNSGVSMIHYLNS